MNAPSQPARSRPRRLLGMLAIAVASAALTLWLTGDRLPELTAEALASARQRWRATAATSYRLVIDMQGSELARGRYRVEVAGERIRVERDGQTIAGDTAAYSAVGLFDLLEQELVLAEDPRRGFGAPPGYDAYLFAEFDPATGLPLRFRRVVGGGSGRWVEWTIVSFDAGR